LKNKYSLREPSRVIEYFNKEIFHEKYLIPDDILEDIDIEPYGNSEITIWKKKWKNEKKNIKEIILVDENDKEYKFDIPEEITVK
jgi:hypothetical protein